MAKSTFFAHFVDKSKALFMQFIPINHPSHLQAFGQLGYTGFMRSSTQAFYCYCRHEKCHNVSINLMRSTTKRGALVSVY